MDSYLINTFLHPTGSQTAILTLVFVWSLIWKGLALWRSAKSNDNVWFVALLLVNTVGLLEIAYIFYLSKDKLNPQDVRKFISSLDTKKLTLFPKKKQSK